MGSPHRKHLPVKLSLRYEGKGMLGYFGGAELDERTPGHDLVRNLRREEGFAMALIRTDGDDPVRNIRLFERGRNPTETYRQSFLDRVKGMSAIRFMDWMKANETELATWDERPKPGYFADTSSNGVPLENMIELANIVHAAPWFTMPHMADDDFNERFATMVRSQLDPSLPVYVEYSNEVWNSMLPQAGYAAEQGRQLKLSYQPAEGALRFYSQRTGEIIRIWKRVFADNPARVLGVYASQLENPAATEVVLSWQDAYRTADVLAVAPYFTADLGSRARSEDVSAWPLDKVFAELAEDVNGKNRASIKAQADIARRYGLPLVAYAGGQGLVGYEGSETNEQLTNLFIAANRDPRMGELMVRQLEHWHSEGGGLFMIFNSMMPYSNSGSWGLLEFEGDSTPKWEAIRQLVQAQART